MNLENICVILDHPDEPRNIGSACRAMANNDIKKLRIVGKKSDYDAEKISVLAIHGFYVYENEEFFNIRNRKLFNFFSLNQNCLYAFQFL